MPCESEPCSCAQTPISAAITASSRDTPQSTNTSRTSDLRSSGDTCEMAATWRSLSAIDLRSFAMASGRRCCGEEGLGVAVEDLLVDLIRIAERAPILDKPLK